MAQKDKVKELVGRGLDSYHTKALQQIDRIEKKNKEQNHKINILTNELDNDYLTKIEEGSVVSLEHSKEGMVYLDELQGNTLVNYCTDGAKELTLNGDIDIEGTSVTLTEGVDNGLVDVMCEGNTLVNLAPNGVALCNDVSDFKHNYFDIKMTQNSDSITFTTNQEGFLIAGYDNRNNNMLKHNSKYIVMWDIEVVKISGEYMYVGCGSYESMIPKEQKNLSSGRGIVATTFSTNSKDITSGNYGWISIRSNISNEPIGSSFKAYGCVVLELSDEEYEKPIDELINKYYKKFEGMKSVGECEDNKIEIISQNKNLWNLTTVRKQDGTIPSYEKVGNTITYNHIGDYGIFVPIKVKKGDTLRISGTLNNVQNIRIFKEIDNFQGQGIYNVNYNGVETTIQNDYVCNFTESGTYHIRIWCRNTGKASLTNFLAEISSTNTSYVEHRLNKKEISLNEPLRGFENGKKDRFIKINNKWFIERNCGMRSSTEFSWQESGRQFENHYCVFVNGLGCKRDSRYLSTAYPYISDAYATYLDASYISNNSNTGYDLITLTIPKSKLTTVNIVGAREYLNNNPFDFMVELATPTYEEITDVELITYLDTTHISNNSTIPCNMKIQNSGYNAIIKPSTLYTVALDTDESGTIGLNLGGAKVTTTNNVATITTPATLVDDSLRLHGKGIKASNVRLLEGDKTNCVPSYFEGMKSSFEDKLQDDGTFKMEILSNNRNLSVVNNYSHTFDNGITNSQKGSVIVKNIRVEPNTTYYISCSSFTSGFHCFQAITSKEKINVDNHVDAYHQRSRELNVLNTRIMTNDNEKYITLTTGNWECTGNNNKFEIKDLMLEKADSKNEYVPNEQNKIQFSSIEPLRGIGDVKDRFVFKDSKLMIERNCGEIVLNGSEGDKAVVANGSWFKSSIEGMASVFVLYNTPKKIGYNTSICERFTNTYNANPFSSGKIKSFTYTDHPTLNTMYFDYGDNPNVTVKEFCEWLSENPTKVVYQLAEPTYEEIPFELQKIILECFENGTLFIDTNIPPTVTTTYSGETPIVKSVRLNKTEVSNNTTDINDNIVPYLMDMDFRVVCLQLEGGIENVSVARLFGGTYEMLQRDILSNRYSKEEYKYRLDAYLSANKITHEEYTKLGDMLNG